MVTELLVLMYAIFITKDSLDQVKQGRTIIEEKKNKSLRIYTLGAEENLELVFGLPKNRCWFFGTFVRLYCP